MRGLSFADYEALRLWSVTEIEGFWAAIWAYFEVISDAPPTQVLDRRVMPGAKWFPGARVNYAEHLMRYEAKARSGEVAIHHLAENRPLATMSWALLGTQVRKLATRLRELGIQPGDRVVSCMPNVPETTIAMIATIAVFSILTANFYYLENKKYAQWSPFARPRGWCPASTRPRWLCPGVAPRTRCGSRMILA